MKNKLLFIVLLFSSLHVSAQDIKPKDIFTSTVRYHYGVILPHHKSIKYLTKDRLSAVEVNFGILPSNSRSWVSLYNRPEIGLGLYHTNLGNDDVLGNATAVYPYINFHLKEGVRWDFDLQIGMGIAYTDKPFHKTSNYTNIAIGSNFNAFFKFMGTANYALAPKWRINSGIGFCHISNGAIKLPNKGLNMLTGNVGIQYYWNGKKPRKHYYKIEKQKLDNEFSIVWSHGAKQVSEIDEHKYYSTSLSCNYGIGINAKQRIGFGVDFFYDKSANRGHWDFDPQTGFKDRFSQAIILTHDLVIQRFSIIANIGVYTLYETSPEHPIYSRLGLRYQITKNIVSNISLKAHLGKADFIEWGIGYKFKTKRHAK